MEFDSREDRLTISIWLKAMLRADTQSRYDMLSIYERIYNGECIFEIKKDYSDSEGSGIITWIINSDLVFTIASLVSFRCQ